MPATLTSMLRALLAGGALACTPLAVVAQAPPSAAQSPAPGATPMSGPAQSPAPGAVPTSGPAQAAAGPTPTPVSAPAAGAAQPSVSTPAQAAAAPTPPPMSGPVPAPAANAPSGPPRGAQAVREFLGLGPAPDAAAAKRGAPIFASNCAFCHGPQARGAEGPSLIYSELVLKDVHGATVADFLKAGRPEKGMPSFATLSDEQRRDVAEFLHQQIEDVANRGTYEIKNIVLGNPKKGASYVAAHCLGCHSITGDLKGLGEKWRPADLQRYWIMPPRTAALAITATVRSPHGAGDAHRPSGGQRERDGQHASEGAPASESPPASEGPPASEAQHWQGRVQQIDDFRISLVNESGQLTVVERTPGVTVELHDPLAPHVAMIGNLADPDMINVTAYLESLK